LAGPLTNVLKTTEPRRPTGPFRIRIEVLEAFTAFKRDGCLRV
jgi:hypothetical protein